jgi:hypothetical protein
LRPARRTGPFERIISPSQLHRVDPEIREALLKTRGGGHVVARGMRHPISAHEFYKVRLANEHDFLGPNMVGTAESGRSTTRSDDDGDLENLIFPKSKEAQEEGWHAINDMNSRQWRATIA